jgi:hypothetical protein
MSALGKLLYKLYYEPRNKRATIKKFGGRQKYREMLAAERQMKHFALHDLVIGTELSPAGKFKINFLTGDKFIHQTLFCTYSFLKFLSPAEAPDFSVTYFSDGTLSTDLTALLKKRFPQIKIVDSVESERALTRHLPESSFPYLNKNVRRFPLFKKLIYPNLGNEGLLTFFDSDMLFLRRPVELLDWLYGSENKPDRAFCIQDVQRSYGYTDQEIWSIWPHKIEHDINSGLYAFHSKNLDWSFFEELSEKFEISYGPHYYMEQLMTAMMLKKSPELYVASKSAYIVFPSERQVEQQTGTLHHYVNESKAYYFKAGWQKQLR